VTLIHFVTFSLKNVGGAIGVIIGSTLGVYMLTIIFLPIALNSGHTTALTLARIIQFLPQGQNNLVTFSVLSKVLSASLSINFEGLGSLILYIFIDLGFSILFIFLGLIVFRKSDLK
jgi:hypothetical protein